MRPARAVIRWLADWRTGVTIAGSVLAAVLLLVVLDARAARQGAIDAATSTAEQAIDTREAATRRIDLLSQKFDRLVVAQNVSSSTIARLEAEVAALEQQVDNLGERPVTRTSSPSTSSPPADEPDERRSPPSGEPDAPPPADEPTEPDEPPDDPGGDVDPQPEPFEPLCILLNGVLCQE